MGPRVYPSYQNPSQLISPTVGPLTPTPTPVPTPTPTPVPGIPIILSGLTLYVDGQSISYPGTGTTWTNLQSGGFSVGNVLLQAIPNFNYRPTYNFFSFDGLVDYAYNPDTPPDDSFTFGGWFRAYRGPVGKCFMGFGEGLAYDFIGTGSYTGQGIALFKDVNDYLTVQVWNQIDVPPGSGPNILTGATVSSTTKLPNNEWSYIVATYQKNVQVKIYLDGALIKTGGVPTSGNLISPGSNIGWVVCKGPNIYPNNKIARMDIGDLEAYNRVLSDAEVLSNYNAQVSKYI
jgi:hypothetical protein